MSRNQRRNRRNKSGGSQTAPRNGRRDDVQERSTETAPHRSSTETKSSLRTTELIAYAAAVLAVVMTALAVDEDAQGGTDPFGAETAIRYITYLTIGYLIARGLAKSGSWNRSVRHDTDLADDDAAPTAVTHDDDTREDEGDDQATDAEVSDAEGSDATAPSSDDAEHAEVGSAAKA